MMKDLKELMKKKAMKGEFMDEKKRSVMHELLNEMDEMANESLTKGMKKVTVAAKDEEGLKAGLEKAEEMVEEKMGEEEYEESEMPEEEYAEESEEAEMSMEELEAEIKKLEEKKARLME